MTTIEVAGFVSGAVCVWLYVRQNVWAWPVGLVNSAAWLVLFWRERLFLDSGLQAVYLVLGVLGWVWWVRGGGPGKSLSVTRTSGRQAAAILTVCLPVTLVLWWAMRRAGDSAPLPDAATAVASLAAQYMLTRKLLGTWWVWIAVDLAYLGLYTSRGLYLTAALQPVFIALCVAGLLSWRRELAARESTATVPGSLAVAVGKFLPPHAGHSRLLETAQREADAVLVVVCERADDPWPGEQRAEALRRIHPGVIVVVTPDDIDEHDAAGRAHEISRAWAERVRTISRERLGSVPDVVVSSEEYGPRFAGYLGARHVSVDASRTQRPVSGTAVRQDPLRQWRFLHPEVRSWFAVRVVVGGAESTGTTTLARALADHYGCPWVPEYGREYSERRLALGPIAWRTEDFEHIAATQADAEDRVVRSVVDGPAGARRPLVVADTDVLATGIWHERYLESSSVAVEVLAASRRYDLYVLTGDEIPFEQDGMRDGEQLRGWMTQRFRDRLAARTEPWVEVRGTVAERLAVVVPLIDALIAPAVARSASGPSPVRAPS